MPYISLRRTNQQGNAKKVFRRYDDTFSVYRMSCSLPLYIVLCYIISYGSEMMNSRSNCYIYVSYLVFALY